VYGGHCVSLLNLSSEELGNLSSGSFSQHPSERGLFIVGHARSGTTVLQYALNSSQDIHIFGEANFQNHSENGEFAAWYNSMHESFGNPPAKGDRCPDIRGNLESVLKELRSRYRWVGDKVAFRHESLGYSFSKSYSYQYREFPLSVYILTMRRPSSVLSSNVEMFSPEDIQTYVDSILACLLHTVNMYLTFDRCLMLSYEEISPATFDCVADFLNTPLGCAYNEYDRSRQLKRSGSPTDCFSERMSLLSKMHEEVVDLVSPKSLRIANRSALRRIQRQLYELVNSTASPKDDALYLRGDQKHLV
jgi:hypothetical protein